jgi:dTDP-glucose 4,6-dehydratase/UDP-glucose 4-epimerase
MVELFGTGSETRDFIFIDDIVQAIELVIHKSVFRGECINVANGQEISIKEAVHVFYDALAWEGKISFVGNTRKGDPLNWQADINELRSLGYKQSFDLNKGLKAYAKWVREKG